MVDENIDIDVNFVHVSEITWASRSTVAELQTAVHRRMKGQTDARILRVFSNKPNKLSEIKNTDGLALPNWEDIVGFFLSSNSANATSLFTSLMGRR